MNTSRLRTGLGWSAAAALPVVFLLVFFLWPVGAMLGRGLSVVTDVEILTELRTWRIVLQTLWMACAGSVASVLLGVPGAYILYCTDFPGRRVLRGFTAVPFVLPTVVVGIAFRALLEGPLRFLGLAGTTWAVVLAMVFFNYTVVVRTVGVLWQSLDTRAVQAARSLGATPWQAFRTVTLPQLMPAIAAAASLVFLYCSTAYGIVTTLGNPGYGTLESEIYLQTVAYFNLDRAAVLCVLQCVVVAFALLWTTRLTAQTETALRVRRSSAHPLTRTDLPAFAVTALTAAFLFAPLLALAVRAFRVNGGWTLHNFRALATAGSGFSGGTTVLEALNHSLKIAFDATVIALLVGVPLALVLSRRVRGAASSAQRLLDGLVLLPLGVSTVTVGFGFLITFARSPLGNSPVLVPLAQAVVALPLVVRAIVPVLRAIDPRMRQAARTLGATEWQVVRTIDVPYLLRGLGLATSFAFAVSLGEFGATSFLANPDYLTLPVVIVKLLQRPGADNYGMALAGALILALLTAGVMTLAEWRKEREIA